MNENHRRRYGHRGIRKPIAVRSTQQNLPLPKTRIEAILQDLDAA